MHMCTHSKADTENVRAPTPTPQGRGDTSWTDSRARGDEIVWMSQDVEADSNTGHALVGVLQHMHGAARRLWTHLYPGNELEK